MPKSPICVASKICTGRKLAKILAEVQLTDREFEAWRRDLRNAYKTLKASLK